MEEKYMDNFKCRIRLLYFMSFMLIIPERKYYTNLKERLKNEQTTAFEVK